MASELRYTITSAKRKLWFEDIIKIRSLIRKGKELHLTISSSINRNNFENYHIVTLSCLIDYTKKISENYVYLCIEDKDLKSYIFNDVRLRSYWKNEINTSYKIPENSRFNLWRLESEYYTGYTIALNDYFANVYFQGKDLAGLGNCISELFQNIIDHSEADGTAFFAIDYDEKKGVIDIAVCDFGVGIPHTLRSQYKNSCEALQKCLIPGVTAGTQKHNRGFGMDNIASMMSEKDSMHIVSNNAILLKNSKKEIALPLPFDFRGTLIYMTISQESFEDIEYIEQFNCW